MDDRPLILTLRLDALATAGFEALRQAHFPPHRNLVPAHVSMFHALPGQLEAEILARLRAVATGGFSVAVTGVRSLGRGVAFRLHTPELLRLRAGLASDWAAWLGAQDRSAYAPHVTVQNKVTPEAARALLERLQSDFTPWQARAEGLMLWRYLGGPWELRASVDFPQ